MSGILSGMLIKLGLIKCIDKLRESRSTKIPTKNMEEGIFDFRNKEYLVLNALPKVGQKVTFTTPSKWLFHKEIEKNEKLLKKGEQYTVRKYHIGGSTTYIELEEFHDPNLDEYKDNQKMFSVFAFSWDTPELDLTALIGSCPFHIQTRLSEKYNLDIDIDGELEEFGGNKRVLKITTEYKQYPNFKMRLVKSATIEDK